MREKLRIRFVVFEKALAMQTIEEWAATTTPPTPDANGVYE